MTENFYCLLLLLCISTLSTPQETSVCFSDSGCGVDVERPVFYLGTSFDDCCAKPDVLSVLTDNCVPCVLSADRVTPLHVALYPPDSILLEVTATGYDTISWFINGTAMHDFDHLLLEDYNKKLTIINTTVDDYGIYSADIHTLQNADFEVVVIDFYVYKYVSPNVELSTPSENEIANEQLNLTCSAVGNPVPSINVYCDNITILSFDDPIFTEPEQFGSLPINSQTVSVIASDADGISQCHCNATAYDGTDIETKTVSAQILPVSASILSFQYDQSLSVIAPLKIELSCMGKGRPVPSVTWYKGENEITSNNDDDTVSINESISEFVISSNLTITNSSSSDYGLYHCGVSNLHGAENSTTVLMDVQIPSNVTVPNTLVEVNVNIQKEVSFHCESVGNPEPQIIWLGDGGILNNNCGTQGSLGDNFGEAALDYDQFYSGNAQDNIADGYVPKNCEIQITRDDSVEGIVTTNSTLIIRELDLENIQSTSFRCIAENNVVNLLGVTKHVKIVLKLEDDPYFLRNPLDYYNLLYTNSATFNCDVIGQSSLIITWLKDGIALSEQNTDISITSFSENAGLLINSTLTIDTLDSNDEGKYTCQAQNNEGVSQYNFTVDIYGVLTIHDTLTAFTYTVGETLVISCNITSTTAPVISWIHQGVTLTESNNIFINNNEMILTDGDVSVISTLTITELEITDDGLYNCQATNEHTAVEQNIASVTINVPVTATVNPKTSIHFNQTTTTINCTASGIPAPTVQFINVTCNNEELGEAAEAEESGDFSVYCIYELQNDVVFTATAMAVITTVSKFDTIELFCTSENSISTANDTGLIIIQAAPVIISNAISNIDVVVDQSFSLSCNASGYPAPSVVWTLDNDVLTNNGSVITTDDSITLSNGLQYVNSVLTITSATFNDEGVYMCSFSNDAGTSSLNIATVDIRVPVTASVNPNTSIHSNQTTTTINCTASSIPAPTVQFINVICNDEELGEAAEAEESGDFSVYCIYELQNGGVFTVTAMAVITTVSKFDTIELFCSSENSISTANDTGLIIIQAAPVIIYTAISNIDVVVDQSFSLSCNASGYPAPSVVWTLDNDVLTNNGSVITTDDSITLSNGLQYVNSVLTINSAIFDDEGVYMCSFSNDAGTSNLTIATVDIRVSPTVNNFSESLYTHIIGNITTVSCIGYGDPAIDMIFHGLTCTEDSLFKDIETSDGIFNGSCYADIDSNGVVIMTVSLTVNDDAEKLGVIELTCTGSNSLGVSSKSTNIQLTGPPQITDLSPQFISLEYGESLSLICTATGYPLPNVYWSHKNNTNSIPSLDQEIDMFTIKSTVSIFNVDLSNEGEYYCIAENNYYSKVNSSVLVSITTVPVTATVNPNASIHFNQTTTTINCTASGIPAPTVQFINVTCNNEELGEAAEAEESGDFSVYCIYELQNDVVFTVTAMAVITTVSKYDPIELFCSSENSISTANDTGLIIIQAAPVIISNAISNIDVVIDQSFFLSCNASGYPDPSVVWTLDNDVLTNNGSNITTDDSITLSNGLQYVNSVLTINSATFDDEGVYMCSFSNDAGTSNLAIATVDIRVPPLITVSNETITTLIGSSESLYCNASGFPAPVISWFKSDILVNIGSGNSGDYPDTSPLVEIIDNNDTHNIITTIDSNSDDIVYTFSKLVIETVQLSDEGLYSCSVWNEFGHTIVEVGQLIVEEPPSIYLSQPVTYTVPGDDDTTIFCTGTGKPQPSVTFGEQKCSGQSQDYIWNGITITCGSSNILNGLPHITSTITLTPLISFFGELNLTCLVENGLSPIASGMVTVDVEVDKTVLITPNTITVNESDSIVLLCEATDYPLPSIDWIIGGESVIENERLMINTQQTNAYTIKSTLTLSNIAPDDEEIYKCRAESIGSFLIDSSSVQVIEIDECLLLQDPCVNGTCQDGLNEYTCVCDEGFSGTNCDIPDDIKDPIEPIVTENPPNITEAFLLGEINITCYATGDPEPTIYWYKDDVIVDDVIGSELVITEAKPSDRGYYHCEAVNDGGNETSDPGLVKIQGITQYVAEIGTGSVFDDQNTVEKMVNCLTSEYITGSNKTIVYSLEYCTALGCQHDGVAAILLTLYQTRMPYSTQGLRNALSNKLEDINTDCGTNVTITDVWRFDGCRETREIFRANLSLSILWTEAEITEETVNPCPCGSLTSSVYTNSTAIRKCGGDYTNGGVWLDSDTSSCDYNELNEDITLTLCHLTEVYVASELASSLESITEDASIFQSLDFTIASLVLENLALSQDIKSDREIQEMFIQSISNLMFVNRDIAVDSQRKHDSTSRILRAIDSFQTAIDLPTNTTMTQFVTENVAFHMLETSSSSFVNMTFQVNLEDYDSISNNGITIDYRHNVSLFNSSLSVPENVLEGRTGATIDEPIRVSYAVFLRDILFQESPGSVYGSRIAANNLTVGSIIVSASLSSDNQIINITDLVTPIVIKFRKPESLLLNSSESYCVFWDDKNSHQSWSSDGCVLVDISNEDIVSCECNHLTHFGYLLDVQPSDNQPDDLLALEIIIYILCILSIICLIIVVFTYATSKKLRFHTQGKTIINMSLALIGVYTCYMVAVNAKAIRDIEGIRGDILCGFFGALLYYFLLVYFMWTSLEAIDLYRKLVRVFNKKNKHFVIYGGILCWGIPLLITAIATTAGREDYIQYEYFCRPVGPTFYVGFLVPFGLIYLFNWILFIIIVAKLISRRAQKTDYTSSHGLDYRKIFFVAMILSVNFGLGWIFGLLVTSQYPEPLYITFIVIFSLFVGFQGILIFFLHCIRNQNARQTWRVWFYVLCCCENVRNAQTLSNNSYSKPSGVTPAMRRKNYNSSGVPEHSSEMKIMPSLAQKYFTSSVVESETGNIDSPLHESNTMETYLGADDLASPVLDMTNIFDFTTVDEKTETKRMSKASSKASFGRFKIGTSSEKQDLMAEDVKKKRWSKQESKKSLDKKKLSKKTSKKTTRVEKLIETEELDGSLYSLGSQVLEIQYKPTIGEEDSDDEEVWRKLSVQFDDVNKMINSSFFDKNQSSELHEVLY